MPLVKITDQNRRRIYRVWLTDEAPRTCTRLQVTFPRPSGWSTRDLDHTRPGKIGRAVIAQAIEAQR